MQAGASRGWVLCSGLAESGSSLATISSTSPLLTPLFKGRGFLAGAPVGPDSWAFSPWMVVLCMGSVGPGPWLCWPGMSAFWGELAWLSWEIFWLPELVPLLDLLLGWLVEISGV